VYDAPHEGQGRQPNQRLWCSVWRRRIETTAHQRIQGALFNLGHTVERGTIAKITKQYGSEPAPERVRKTTWKEFLVRVDSR